MVTVMLGESATQVQLCYSRFKERRDVNDDARPGRPSMSKIDENIEVMEKIFLDNRRITIREVAHAKQFFGNVFFCGHEAVITKIVPKLLNFEQKQRGTDIAQDAYDVQRQYRFAQKGHSR